MNQGAFATGALEQSCNPGSATNGPLFQDSHKASLTYFWDNTASRSQSFECAHADINKAGSSTAGSADIVNDGIVRLLQGQVSSHPGRHVPSRQHQGLV